MRSVLITQAIVLVVAALSAYLWRGGSAAQAAGFGAAIAFINVLLLNWRLQQGKRPQHADPQRHLRGIYFSAIERLLVVATLLALGLGVLKLMPAALLVAFIAGQLAWIVAGSLSRKY
jgi:F0F1-type ATP synthase assembly protein I